MKSSYKRLGNYIQLKKEKNIDLKATTLLGINIDKFFMPSVANIVGTDLSNYRIVRRDQFACNRMHVGRDYRIPIALSRNEEPFMVSPAYDVFEIIDTTVLLPEYLMMWFSRKEFDRNTWFHTDADVRGGLPWDAFSNLMLPIPSLEKQEEIIKEYHIIQNRITLNNQLIGKLEEMAQTIYKQWFVDFEFPDENGKPYKSNGGKMVWCEELEKEIPEGWEVNEFQKITDVTSGKSLKSDYGNSNPVYGAGGITGYTDDYLFDRTIIIIGRVGTHGKVFIEYNKSWPTDNTLVFTSKYLYYSYFILKELNYDELNKGGVQALLTQTDLKQIKILTPNFDINEFENVAKPILLFIKNKNEENQKLEELKELLLGRMVREN